MTDNKKITNLDDTVDQFEFVLNGKTYVMRYPTTEEVEQAGTLKTDEEKTDFMYSLVSPVTEGAEPIKEALRKAPVSKAKAFGDMITAQLSA